MSHVSLFRYPQIILIGLMGAGKTRIGRELSSILDLAFIDADNEIEKAAGCPVNEIFEKYGEESFRQGEKKVIKRLLLNETGVLATGGGAFMNDETRKNIKESSAVSVWLNADIDLLVLRTRHSTHRPLLQVKDPKSVLQNLIEERYPVYELADVHVKCENISAHKMAEKVQESVAEYLGGWVKNK